MLTGKDHLRVNVSLDLKDVFRSEEDVTNFGHKEETPGENNLTGRKDVK